MAENAGSSSRRSGFRTGVLFTGGGTAINAALLFVETMVAVRLLSMESYGLYVILMAVANLLTLAVDGGCKTAVTRLIAGSNAERQAAIVNTAMSFRLIAIAGLALLVWLGRDALVLLDPSQILRDYALYLPVMVLVASYEELASGLLQGFQRYRPMAVAQALRGILRLVLTMLFLAGLQLGAPGLIYSWVLSFAVSAAYQYLSLPVTRRLICRRSLLAEMLGFGLPIQMTRLVWFVFGRVHVFLLGLLAGPASVAFYEVAARIPDALQRLFEAFTAVYYPTMSALLSEGNRRRAAAVLDRSLRLVSFATALAALGALLFSREIVVLLFSSRYADSAPVFGLLMIALHMTFISTLLGYTLTAAGFPGRALVKDVSQAGLNVVGDLLLIPLFGIIGPAYATIGAAYLSNPMAVWLAHRSGTPAPVAPHVKQVAVLWACAALSWQAQTAAVPYRMAVIALFIGLSLALSIVSHRDLGLVLPFGLTRRLSWRKEPLVGRD